MALPVAMLYAEELKATMRGRFAWLGAAVVLLAVGGLATVGTQDTWLDGYGIVAYCLVPLGFLPMAAGMVASPRVNRFVECVFTAPVGRGDWLVAKLLVLLTLAAGYYAALLPMMLVYTAHVGVPLLLKKLLLWAAGLLLASLAVGALLGVMFIGRSLAAPTGAAMGLVLAYAGLIPLQELMVSRGNGATHSGHIALASPAVLIKNGLGFAIATRSIPSTTAMTWVSYAVVVVGSLGLAAWIFLRAQGVETWETTRTRRWTIALALAAVGLFPVLFADTNYDKPAPSMNNAPPVRFSRAATYVALVEPGGDVPRRCCSPVLNREEWPLATDHAVKRDLLLLLPVEATARVSDLRTQVVGGNGLEVTAAQDALVQSAPPMETHAYTNDGGPEATDGHHVVNGWVGRIPIVLDPTKPWDIGGNRYPLSIAATYTVAGESGPRAFSARAAVDAEIGSAIYQMGFAASVLPLVCLGAAFARWRRTR